MSDTTMDPRAIAQAAAIEVADEDSQVGRLRRSHRFGRQRH